MAASAATSAIRVRELRGEAQKEAWGLKIGRLTMTCKASARAYSCHHAGAVDTSWMPDALPLKAIERWLFCTACGAIGAVDARPDWSEIYAQRGRAPIWMTPPAS